jgi:hypothetical protein
MCGCVLLLDLLLVPMACPVELWRRSGKKRGAAGGGEEGESRRLFYRDGRRCGCCGFDALTGSAGG